MPEDLPDTPWPLLPEIIHTDRLVLRPWRLDDVDDVLAYAQDEQWSRFLRLVPFPYDRSDAEHFLARQLLLDRTVHPAWAMTLDGTVIGGINIRLRREWWLAEIGYSIARRHWNQGLCSDAARAVIDTAFGTWTELNRVCARADEENGASQRVMAKVGMTKEGVLRQSRVERGVAFDEAWWGLLRSEWNPPA